MDSANASGDTSRNERVIDFGAHIYPEASFPSDYYDDTPLIDRVDPYHTDPEQLSKWFAAAGVDEAVLSQPLYLGGYESLERTASANDALCEVIRDFDEFHGLAAIPVMFGGENAAGEFERCLDAGYNGGAIETKTDGVELVDSELDPVFEVSDRTGAPLLVHPKMNESVAPGVFDDEHMLNAIFGREIAIWESICKVIHEGVLDRYPDLNLVFHHTGGNIASMMGRVQLQLDEGRWPGRQTEGLKNYEEFRAQLEERVYIDTSGFFGWHAPVRAALEEFPDSQVLFGSDAPWEPRSEAELTDFVETIEDLTSRRDAEKILGTNARDILINVE